MGAAPSPEAWAKAPLWWGAGVVVVSLIGLATLDWAVLMLHALGYGISQVTGSDAIAVPDTDRHVRALVVGGLADIAGTAVMLWLLLRTAARRWPAWTTGPLAAAVGAVIGASALLLLLGVNPVDVIVS